LISSVVGAMLISLQKKEEKKQKTRFLKDFFRI